jgi:hypothetical protein
MSEMDYNTDDSDSLPHKMHHVKSNVEEEQQQQQQQQDERKDEESSDDDGWTYPKNNMNQPI